MARGRLIHGRFLAQRDSDPDHAEPDPQALALFERATQLYQRTGDPRGEAEALFWTGCFHQVEGRDDTTAVPVLERALALARHAGDPRGPPRGAAAPRHRRGAAAGRLDLAQPGLAELDLARLRREQLPGVAANMVGLIYIALAQGRREDARALADEAQAIAESARPHHSPPGRQSPRGAR